MLLIETIIYYFERQVNEMKVVDANLSLEEVVRRLLEEGENIFIQLAQLPLNKPRYLGWESKGLCHVFIEPQCPFLEQIREAAWVDLQPHYELSIPCFLFNGDTTEVEKIITAIKERPPEPPKEKVLIRNPKGRK